MALCYLYISCKFCYAGKSAGAVKMGQFQLSLFTQGKVDGAGAGSAGGQSPFSTPTGVVGSIFFCQQILHLNRCFFCAILRSEVMIIWLQ